MRYQCIGFCILLTITHNLWSYTNLTPSQVHSRLMEGDTLLLLDVREVSEYLSGHIAEPFDHLPLTPVNMPLNSGVLSDQYTRLPQGIDIIVYCGSGGRSASASAFLEGKGYTRIFNMSGGFSSWNYESRKNGFGDHSGQWVSKTDSDPVVIGCTGSGDSSRIVFYPEALPGPDSAYVELHYASLSAPIPDYIPVSDILGLFRITALDRFGLSLMKGDSLDLSDTIHIELNPNYVLGKAKLLKPFINENMTVFIPGQGWQSVSFEFDNFTFYRNETVLRRWMNVEGYGYSGIEDASLPEEFEIQAYPNPFNRTIHISVPENSEIKIYNIHGYLINWCEDQAWSPEHDVPSGVYFIRVQTRFDCVTTKVMYIK